MGTKNLGLTTEMAELVSARFRLLGVPVRLMIVQLLESGERSVNQVADALQLTQPNVSRHLKALTEGGVLARRRDGNAIYCSIADPMVFRLCELVCNSAREQVRARLTALEGPARPARK